MKEINNEPLRSVSGGSIYGGAGLGASIGTGMILGAIRGIPGGPWV
ncbi:hypothetical protein ABLA30_23030 [Xenorhabdus nematophila]